MATNKKSVHDENSEAIGVGVVEIEVEEFVLASVVNAFDLTTVKLIF